MSATRKGRDTQSSTSAYISIISAEFENEVTQLAEPTEQEIRQMREEIEEAKKGKEPRLPPAAIQESTGRETLKSSGSMTA